MVTPKLADAIDSTESTTKSGHPWVNCLMRHAKSCWIGAAVLHRQKQTSDCVHLHPRSQFGTAYIARNEIMFVRAHEGRDNSQHAPTNSGIEAIGQVVRDTKAVSAKCLTEISHRSHNAAMECALSTRKHQFTIALPIDVRQTAWIPDPGRMNNRGKNAPHAPRVAVVPEHVLDVVQEHDAVYKAVEDDADEDGPEEVLERGRASTATACIGAVRRREG